MAKKKAPIRAEAKATAKVEAVVKATVQRKKTITEIIPPDVTRAKASAWLALISPITEWAGLRGDQLRHKRTLLRIQQESVLAKIAQQTNERLAYEGKGTTPIPNKFLIPFLEKASTEDIDSELIATWANLLASAATDFDPHMVRFCSILSEIGFLEGQFLHRLCREARGLDHDALTRIEDVPFSFSAIQITRDMSKTIDIDKSLRENMDHVISTHECPGGILVLLGLSIEDEEVSETHELGDEKWERSVSLLQSLGLIEHHLFITGEVEHYSWFVETISLTSFGVAFVTACDPEIKAAFRKVEEWVRKEMSP
jgi:hypothetical protein